VVVADAAARAVEFVGLPEAGLNLSHAVIYLATAPKSNAAAVAVWAAAKDVREGHTIPVPRHLRDRHYKGAARLGHGEGYAYAHDHEGGFVEQDYLGVDKSYYIPTERGHEADIKAYLARIRGCSTPADKRSGRGSSNPGETAAQSS
jgi:putative ATPase